MKYFCNNCSYIYDEAIGDETEEILAGTKIYNLDYCPVCFDKENFSEIKEEIIFLEELENKLIQKEHDININLKNNDLEICFKNHPNLEDNKIISVLIYDEYNDLVKEKFILNPNKNTIIFKNFDLDIFEVRIKCNKHGIFAKKFELNL